MPSPYSDSDHTIVVDNFYIVEASLFGILPIFFLLEIYNYIIFPN